MEALANALRSESRAIHLDEKGRGRALRAAWSLSDAAVVAYLDVDLSTGLDALLPLVAPLVSGHSDVAIGTRLAPGARVVRRTVREIIPPVHLFDRCRLARSVQRCPMRFQGVAMRCGPPSLLPLVKDEEWFFDTEP